MEIDRLSSQSKVPPMFPVLIQIGKCPVPPQQFLPSRSTCSTLVFYEWFTIKTHFSFPLFQIRATCRAHLVRLDIVTRLTFNAMSSVLMVSRTFDDTVP